MITLKWSWAKLLLHLPKAKSLQPPGQYCPTLRTVQARTGLSCFPSLGGKAETWALKIEKTRKDRLVRHTNALVWQERTQGTQASLCSRLGDYRCWFLTTLCSETQSLLIFLAVEVPQFLWFWASRVPVLWAPRQEWPSPLLDSGCRHTTKTDTIPAPFCSRRLPHAEEASCRCFCYITLLPHICSHPRWMLTFPPSAIDSVLVVQGGTVHLPPIFLVMRRLGSLILLVLRNHASQSFLVSHVSCNQVS